MEEYNEFEIFFRTRNSCIIKVPKHYKDKRKIKDFIIDKIEDDELECWVEEWFDFGIEDLEIKDS